MLSLIPFLVAVNVFIFLALLFLLPPEVSSRSWGKLWGFNLSFIGLLGKNLELLKVSGEGKTEMEIILLGKQRGIFHIFTLFNCIFWRSGSFFVFTRQNRAKHLQVSILKVAVSSGFNFLICFCTSFSSERPWECEKGMLAEQLSCLLLNDVLAVSWILPEMIARK